jgi:hypothetical protein
MSPTGLKMQPTIHWQSNPEYGRGRYPALFGKCIVGCIFNSVGFIITREIPCKMTDWTIQKPLKELGKWGSASEGCDNEKEDLPLKKKEKTTACLITHLFYYRWQLTGLKICIPNFGLIGCSNKNLASSAMSQILFISPGL